ncbi:hypothetical protein GGR58DRAFT_504664 [Xylaria digitata]|nr:hypothetical protein GGR58DRAFT_504664 [Xylaria digitata]
MDHQLDVVQAHPLGAHLDPSRTSLNALVQDPVELDTRVLALHRNSKGQSVKHRGLQAVRDTPFWSVEHMRASLARPLHTSYTYMMYT